MLNRYAYCLNNPLKYTDPSGHVNVSTMDGWAQMDYSIVSEYMKYWAINDGDDPSSVMSENEYAASVLGDNLQNTVEYNTGPAAASCLDVLQTMLDFAGVVPLIGDGLDVINGGIYAARGDWGNAGLTAAAAVPFIGIWATGAKIANKTSLHHIVERCQIGKSGFSSNQIFSKLNEVSIPNDIHFGKGGITAYYGSIDPKLSDTMKIRECLAGQDFKTQYNFGAEQLSKRGVYVQPLLFWE